MTDQEKIQMRIDSGEYVVRNGVVVCSNCWGNCGQCGNTGLLGNPPASFDRLASHVQGPTAQQQLNNFMKTGYTGIDYGLEPSVAVESTWIGRVLKSFKLIK